ncbi:MAG: tetratricopeptide repeat protein [Desulfobacteraceae bacterium]|nr:MAG: tetratricopeptide repeat protein [Desulfobacteraceae bacterium]
MTNLFIHILNSLLLFLALRRMTGGVWQSAFAAAVFALHPLQVESVAWISERKNLLCGFFWMLTLLTYAVYTENPTPFRYLVMTAGFTLGVMAKPMIVTLPFVLLLLDYWPLSRFPRQRIPAQGLPLAPRTGLGHAGQGRFGIPGIILEKLPLIGLSALSCALTWSAQHQGGALIPVAAYPVAARVANALVSYGMYIFKTVWPSNLAVFYPLQEAIDLRQVGCAAILLTAVTLWVVKAARQKPYAIVGWLWFAGTLVPVAGLVQAGSQAMADRYMYLPIIGLAIGACWGCPAFSADRKFGKALFAVSASAVALFSTITWIQTGYWKDSITLFSHTAAATSENYLAHNNLGLALKESGNIRGAFIHYSESLRIDPEYAIARINLGNVFAEKGDLEGAAYHYRMALEADRKDSRAYKNLGGLLVRMGKPEEAASFLRKAIELDPSHPDAHSDLGVALALRGRIPEAIPHFKEALRLAPGHKKAAVAFGLAMGFNGSKRKVTEAKSPKDK